MQPPIVDDWPKICQHKRCNGKAAPAAWALTHDHKAYRYYCQHHAQQIYNQGQVNPNNWVQLTPNQRPVSVKE